MKRIAVIGATGLVGAPVTTELIRAGFAVTILAKDEAKARAKFGDGPAYVAGDLRDPAALTRLLTNQDGLYMSLSVKPDSGQPFEAQPAWDELGPPTLTLAQYASQAD